MALEISLKVKTLPVYAGGVMVVVLNSDSARQIGVKARDRVELISNKGKRMICIVDISDSLIKPDEIGVFQEVKENLNVKTGDLIRIRPTAPPESLRFIRKKLEGGRLTKSEIYKIIEDITSDALSEAEVAMWVITTYTRKFDWDEISWLTEAVAYSGDVLEWKEGPILDKHSIGGVPNNRVSPILVPIVASLGYKIPKTSSRSITSPAGTADVVEVFTNVKLSLDEIREIVEKVNGVLAWGGALNIAPADSKMIKARYPLRLDPLPLLLASILGKKKAVGSTHVVIDIPYAEDAKTKNKREAKKLGGYFEKLGKRLNMKIRAVPSDGNQPIGNGIGPVLEAIDVFKVLKREKDRPLDLERKALNLVTELLKLVKHKDVKDAYSILESGKAFEKLREIIEAQGGDPKIDIEDLEAMKGQYTYDILADRDGTVIDIDNVKLSLIAHILGCPKDKGAGMYLYVHIGDKVKRGDKLVTFYSESEFKLDAALKEMDRVGGFIILK